MKTSCAPWLAIAVVLTFSSQSLAQVKWPNKVSEIEYTSSADQTKQPAKFYASQAIKPAPLVVALHPWSADFRGGTDSPGFAEECMRREWTFIYPNFRGPNRRPEAAGSELVVADVLSAVEYAKANAQVDTERIYLMGVSGGGHCSLLMAGRSPETWTAVSAWVPISDLAAWHRESKQETKRRYWKDIEAACGGAPGTSDEVDKQYHNRSPLTWLARAKGLPIDINAGIHDGHTGSVPVSHTLRAFNVLAEPKMQISPDDIKSMRWSQKVPKDLRYKKIDPVYGKKKVLLRRKSDEARVTLFEGTHEIITAAAFDWFDRHPGRVDSTKPE